MAQIVERFDIVIIGAGPTGLLLSTSLAKWGYKIKHVDIRSESTQSGRADGISPRSLDLLCSLGLKAGIMAYKPGSFREVAFWDPDVSGSGINRTSVWESCPSSIGARYPFTTTLQQGLIEDVMIQNLKTRNVHIQRPWSVIDVTGDETNAATEYPLQVTLQNHLTGATEEISSRYLFSGEGAKSSIRERLKIRMNYKESSNDSLWGVVDARILTNFPDITMKCNIRSKAGSMMLIPREDNLVRIYVQSSPKCGKSNGLDDIQGTAQRIIAPYRVSWEHIDWYSMYKIEQAIAERYSSTNQRIFLGGDACHIHSKPKAGQGMNTGFLDAQNLAWKIHAVERGFATRDILNSYESERMYVAKMLIDFDAMYTRLFSKQHLGDTGGDEFVRVFRNASEFTTGHGVFYPSNCFNVDASTHPPRNPSLLMLFPNETLLRGGHLFPALDVTRVTDGSVINLEQAVPFDGNFRIYVFAGHVVGGKACPALNDFARYSSEQNSFYSAFPPLPANVPDDFESQPEYSPKFAFCTIFAAHCAQINLKDTVPGILLGDGTQIYSDDVSVNDSQPQAYQRIGFTPDRPAVVIIRPDGYVGCVLKLVEGPETVKSVNEYFSCFVTKPLGVRIGEIDLMKL